MQACGAHMHVCICGATLRFVFFLCRWFCPFVCVSGFVSFPCRDGLVMHKGGGKWSNQLLFAVVSISLCSMLWSFSFNFYFSFIFQSLYVALPSLLLHSCLFNPLPSRPVSFNLLGLCLSLSFLHHKHFQCWHTGVASHTECSATTIMSMLSSHNNTRITY